MISKKPSTLATLGMLHWQPKEVCIPCLCSDEMRQAVHYPSTLRFPPMNQWCEPPWPLSTYNVIVRPNSPLLCVPGRGPAIWFHLHLHRDSAGPVNVARPHVLSGFTFLQFPPWAPPHVPARLQSLRRWNVFKGPLLWPSHSHIQTSYAGTRALIRGRRGLPSTIIVLLGLSLPAAVVCTAVSCCGAKV